MKNKGIALVILLVMLVGIVGVVFASQVCTNCRGFGTVCPFNSSHNINIPGNGDPSCDTCGISFSMFNCRPCSGTGRR